MMVRHLEQLVNTRPAQVHVHQQHPLPALGHHNGQVSSSCAFALLGQGAGDKQRFQRAVKRGKIKVGAQQAIRLGYVRTHAVERYQRSSLLGLLRTKRSANGLFAANHFHHT